ncbi:MAG: hypothetical protein QOE59_5078 [Actinomycetota bacterium]|nr:hypothetical protein [Actinomycetota bacterium]
MRQRPGWENDTIAWAALTGADALAAGQPGRQVAHDPLQLAAVVVELAASVAQRHRQPPDLGVAHGLGPGGVAGRAAAGEDVQGGVGELPAGQSAGGSRAAEEVADGAGPYLLEGACLGPRPGQERIEGRDVESALVFSDEAQGASAGCLPLDPSRTASSSTRPLSGDGFRSRPLSLSGPAFSAAICVGGPVGVRGGESTGEAEHRRRRPRGGR